MRPTGQIIGWTAADYNQQDPAFLSGDGGPQPYFKKRWVHYYIIMERDHQICIVGHGDYEKILFHCSDVWNGSHVETLSAEHRSKMTDYGMTEERNYLQMLAFSLRVISKEEWISNMGSDQGPLSGQIGSWMKGEQKNPPWPGYYYMKWQDSPERSSSSYYQVLYESDKVEPVQEDTSRLLSWMTSNHTFVGLVGLGSLRKDHVCECIQDFEQAGIRFVYFSPRDERFVKDIGYRLDLETDWNSCILLSSAPSPSKTSSIIDQHPVLYRPSQPTVYRSLMAPKGHLPRGIDNIRNHLVYVDDVPLRISLFAEGKLPHIKEMLDVYQEAGEVVCYWGSPLCGRDIPLYMHAHVSIATDPLPEIEDNMLTIVSGLHAALANALPMKHSKSPYMITQLIREARSFQHNMNSSISFYVSAITCLCWTMCLRMVWLLWGSEDLMLVPLPTNWAGFLWICLVVLPVQSCSLLYSYDDPSVMKWMPKKQGRIVNNNSTEDHSEEGTIVPLASDKLIWRITKALYPRHLFSIGILRKWWHIMILSLFMHWMAWSTMSVDEYGLEFVHLYSQHVFLFIYAMFSLCQSCTCIHAIHSLHAFPPIRNTFWILTSVCVFIMQLGYSYAALWEGPIPFSHVLLCLSWEFWAIFFTSLVWIIFYQEGIVKRYDRDAFIQGERRAKLEFKTKLGMHSPI